MLPGGGRLSGDLTLWEESSEHTVPLDSLSDPAASSPLLRNFVHVEEDSGGGEG